MRITCSHFTIVSNDLALIWEHAISCVQVAVPSLGQLDASTLPARTSRELRCLPKVRSSLAPSLCRDDFEFIITNSAIILLQFIKKLKIPHKTHTHNLSLSFFQIILKLSLSIFYLSAATSWFRSSVHNHNLETFASNQNAHL